MTSFSRKGAISVFGIAYAVLFGFVCFRLVRSTDAPNELNAWATVAVALLTLLLALYTAMLYRSTVQISKDSSERDVVLQRAWIAFVDITPEKHEHRLIKSVSLTLKNYGNSVAQNVQARLDVAITLPGETPGKIEINPNGDAITLIPQMTRTIILENSFAKFPLSEMEDVRQTKKCLWLHGAVEYQTLGVTGKTYLLAKYSPGKGMFHAVGAANRSE